MQRSLTVTVVLVFLYSGSTRAELEDGLDLCSDGLDNDGDGIFDCDETECISSLESCGMLSGPITVGLAAPLVFDAPMSTDEGAPSASLMLADLNRNSVDQDCKNLYERNKRRKTCRSPCVPR
jgi:hypothetical protein